MQHSATNSATYVSGWKLARVIENIKDFFGNTYDDTVHKYRKDNALSNLFLVILPTSLALMSFFIPDGANLTDLGVEKVQFSQLDTIRYLYIRVPYLLLTIFTMSSFWRLYNKYVRDIHPIIVSTSKIFAGLAILICQLYTVFVLFYKPFSVFMLMLFFSYGFAFIFSLVLRSYLEEGKHRFNLEATSAKIDLIEDTVDNWVLVNGVTAVYLLFVFGFFPNIDIDLNNELSNIVLRFSWLLIIMMIIGIILGGIRGRAFNNQDAYKDQVRLLNAVIETHLASKATARFGANRSAAPREDGLNLFQQLLTTSRFFSSTLASLLLWHVSNLEYAVCGLLFLLYSFIFNDAMDYEVDKMAHPERPVASGKLKRSTAFIAAAFVFTAGILVVLLLERHLAYLFFIAYIISTLYSVLLKRTVPVIATPLWCSAVTLIFLWNTGASYMFYLAVFCYFYSRELLLDLRDYEADLIHCKTRSLPCLLGRFTVIFVGSLQITSLVLLLIQEHVLASFCVGLSVLLLIFSLGPFTVNAEAKVDAARLKLCTTLMQCFLLIFLF